MTLSYIQLALLRDFDEGRTLDNVTAVIRLQGAWERAAIEEAYGKLCERHEVLRTTYPQVGNSRLATVAAQGPAVRHLTLDDASWRRDPQLLLRSLSRMNLSPEDDSLCRCYVAQPATGDLRVVLIFSELITDSLSQRILVEDFRALLFAGAQGTQCALPELTAGYLDFAAEDRICGRARFCADSRATGTATPEALAVETRISLAANHRPLCARAHLSAALSRKLMECCFAEQMPPLIVMSACLTVLSSRWSGQSTVTLCVPFIFRPTAQMRHVAGPFTDSLVITVSLDKPETFRELLWLVRAATFDPDNPYADRYSIMRCEDPQWPSRIPTISLSCPRKLFYTPGCPSPASRFPEESAGRRFEASSDCFEWGRVSRSRCAHDLHLAFRVDGQAILLHMTSNFGHLLQPVVQSRLCELMELLEGVVSNAEMPIAAIAG